MVIEPLSREALAEKLNKVYDVAIDFGTRLIEAKERLFQSSLRIVELEEENRRLGQLIRKLQNSELEAIHNRPPEPANPIRGGDAGPPPE